MLPGVETVEVDEICVGVEVADGVEVDTGENIAFAFGAAVETVDSTTVGIDNAVVAFVAVEVDRGFKSKNDIGKETYTETHPPYRTTGKVGTDKSIGQHGFVGLDAEFVQSLYD